MDTVRIGMIGAGYMGRTYAECLRRFTTGGRLAAIWGGSRAAALAAEHGVDCAASLEQLLSRDDVDAVLVATPHSAHLAQVTAAAKAGKHVLVEKPMALNRRECDQMIAACRQAGVQLSVIQTVRFRGTVARAKRMVDDGKIGDVRMIRLQTLFPWEADTSKSWTKSEGEGGLILDQGAHNADFMRWFAGSEATRVFARLRQFQPGAYPSPSAMAQIDFAGGVMASMWMSFELPEPGVENSYFRALVVGSKGMLDIDGFGKLRAALDGRPWEQVWEQPAIDFVNRPLGPERLEAFFTQVQDFIDCVREGCPPAVTGEDGRAAIELIDAFRQADETGLAVELPLGAGARG